MDYRTRAIWILLFLACGFTVISFNLIQIQLVEHGKYLKMAIDIHLHSETLPALRGAIFDADGNVLAQSQRVYDVHLDGKMEAEAKGANLRAIATALGKPLSAITAVFNPKNRYISLADDLSADDPAVTRLTDLKLRTVTLISHDQRTYPNTQMASHVLGFIDDKKGQGLSGMEKDLDKLLSGVPGERWVERDGKSHVVAAYQTNERSPVNGYNVSLTIRMDIQHVVEEQLNQIVQTYHPDGAYIILMNPHTGEILALGSRPTFDPNDRKTFTREGLENGCITAMVEPGSIFKIITLSAVLNEGLVNLDTQIDCENGLWTYAGKQLHDDERNKYTNLPVIEVMAKSSNIGFAKLGIELGKDKLFKYASAFGIGQRTDIFGGQGESLGSLAPVAKWNGLSIARIPIGQEVAASPMQMITAMSVIANGGCMVTPHLTKQVTDETGEVIKTFTPHVVRQVISQETAEKVTKALEQVTVDGTAKNIKIPGHSYVGKTGTAQKIVNHMYSHTQHVASFIGFMPAEDPAFVALVMVDNPKTKPGMDYGAIVSAPVFANIATQVAQILNIEPDLPLDPPALTATTTANNATITR